MTTPRTPQRGHAKKRLAFDMDMENEENDSQSVRPLAQPTMFEESFPKRLSLGSAETIVEEDERDLHGIDGRRTPSPQSSPSKMPATPTPQKTSRFVSHPESPKFSRRNLRFSDNAILKASEELQMRPPEIRFTPPTPNELAANVLLQTPAKQGTHSIFGAEQQGFKNLGAEGSNGPSSVTLSTNFNPFSPMRPRAPGESHKMKADSSHLSRFLSEFEMVEELGRGSYGVVYKCINRTDGWTYAVKKITYKNKKIRKHMLKEAFALAALGGHPNIVRYYSSWENKVEKTKTTTMNHFSSFNNGHGQFNLKASTANLFTPSVVHEKQVQSSLYIQTEFCEGGSLSSQLAKGGKFPQDLLQRMLHQLASALSYMHKRHISHGDIKPANILIDTERLNAETGFKLGDLGQINSDGDGKYLAPEMLGFGDSMDGSIDSDVVSKADIFSLGITVYELAFESTFGSSLNINRSMISQKDLQLPSDRYSVDFVELLRSMVRADPNTRPTSDDLLKHPLLCNDLELKLQHETDMRVKAERELAMAIQRIKELERALANMSIQSGPSNTAFFTGASNSLSSFHSNIISSNPFNSPAPKTTPRHSNPSLVPSTPSQLSTFTATHFQNPPTVSTPQNKRPRSLSFNQMQRGDVVEDVTLPVTPTKIDFDMVVADAPAGNTSCCPPPPSNFLRAPPQTPAHQSSSGSQPAANPGSSFSTPQYFGATSSFDFASRIGDTANATSPFSIGFR